MCTCMHRRFFTQILNNSGLVSATSVGIYPLLSRNGVDTLLLVTKNVSTNQHPGKTQKNFPEENYKTLQHAFDKTTRKCLRNQSEHYIESALSQESDMDSKGKRTRERVSPLRPPQKRKVKSFVQAANLDFIPLPPGSPKQKTDDDDDFFIIDTVPSEIAFPIATGRSTIPSALPSTSKRPIDQETLNDPSIICLKVDDNVAHSSSQSPGRQSRQQNITEQRIKKESNPKKRSCTLPEPLQPNLLGKGKGPSKVSVGLLSAKKVLPSAQQKRSCHGCTKTGLKDNLGDMNQEEIEEIKLIDPDVVEIADIASSDSETKDIPMIDITDSEEDSDSSVSDYETKHMDISNNEYISLQKLRVADFHNTNIEIDDETFKLREKVENLRKWSMTGLGEQIMSENGCKKSETMFTVMSYNVLAQCLLTQNMSLYKSCNPKYLTWQYRWALIQHEIDHIDPDVLMLQEVQASHYHSYYLPWLTFKGYEGFFKKRTGTKTDGCAIFYKTNKFSLVEHNSVEYYQPRASQFLNRDNVGLIVKLVPLKRPNSTPVCIATTHLLYNPKRYDIKLAQMVLLLTEIDRLCYEQESSSGTQYCPVILSGDFNAVPYTALLDFVKKGRLNYEGRSCRSLTQHSSSGRRLGTELIPSLLGITDRCQHSILAQSRFLKNAHGPSFSLINKRQFEESMIHLHHSDRKAKQANMPDKAIGPKPTGWITHGFNLNSVYSHRLNRLGGAPEVTTKHDQGWTTVDYLLYSRVYSQKHARPIEGKLKLLARYGLLSGGEANKFSPLPSNVCPSDHFPLAAQFLLR